VLPAGALKEIAEMNRLTHYRKVHQKWIVEKRRKKNATSKQKCNSVGTNGIVACSA
jgi:hypothetical protein